MKVLMVDASEEKNAYHRELNSALREKGVEVETPQSLWIFTLIRHVLNHRDADIIHITWTHSFFLRSTKVKTFAALLLFFLDVVIVKILRKKIIWTVHNKYNHEKEHKHLDLFLSRILARMSDQIKVECNKAKKTISDLFRIKNQDKINVIPEGNYINAYPNERAKTETREKLGINEDKFVYVYFGQIREYKGVPELVDQFSKLEGESNELWIVGNPHDEEIEKELEGMVKGKDRITLVPEFVPDEEIQDYINSADVVVTPYRDIMTSGSSLLAMSFGKPLIAPFMGCIPEVVSREGTILYDPNNENGLLEAMSSIQNQNLEKMGEKNYQKAKNLKWSSVADSIIKMYEKTL